MKTQRYGWKPALPDHRNLKYALLAMRNEVQTVLPSVVNLIKGFGPVVDQGQLGSCTANAGAAMFGFILTLLELTYFTPSRLFIYYWERFLQGTVKSDSGATITECFKVLAQYGVCDEAVWPYIISKFKTEPPKADEASGLEDLALSYQQLDSTNLTELKTCLAAGFPIQIGFTVYESFETDAVAKTGVVPMPKKSEQILGGHSVVIAGYDDSKQLFTCRNSWGTEWGQEGYFQIPYAYLTNKDLASDFWTLRKVA
jgi:C1A family cysteine protease